MPCTAMIVDDNQEMRETLKSILTGTAVVVDECQDGSEVLEHYRHSHPDYVLMDIAMRSVDGLRATRILLKEFPEAKVVIVSQFDGEEIRFEAKQAGSVGYVHKESLNQVLKLLQ